MIKFCYVHKKLVLEIMYSSMLVLNTELITYSSPLFFYYEIILEVIEVPILKKSCV